MPLSCNETKTRAVAFSNKWKVQESEDAESKSFRMNFNVSQFQKRGGTAS
jgi:hypothetical protein